MIKKTFILMGLLLFCAQFIWAQNYLIKGTITDVSGDPVIGANVKVKRTAIGTISNTEGKFTLTIPESAKQIEVSFIGFISQTIDVKKGMKPINVTLKEDAEKLDEVVIVGYGTQKKSSLTSSVETIKSDEILKMPTARLDQALIGKVSGLQVINTTGDPGTMKEANIRIRVNGNANTAPLLVIDGVPRYSTTGMSGESRLSDLNPDDIESISILKDAAAAAVYGIRAANGVILVKTKRGKANMKLSVSYHGQYNLTKATQLPEFLNSYEFALLYNEACKYDQTHKPFTDIEMDMIKRQSNPNLYADTDILSYLKKYGYNTSHSVSLSGGGQKVRYYMSVGYANTIGMYSGVGRTRYNYSMKLDVDLLKGLTMSVDMSGIRSDNKQTNEATISQAYNYSPLQPLEYEPGKLTSIQQDNPLIDILGLRGYKKTGARIHSTTVNLRYEFPFLKGLSIYARATFDDSSSERTNFKKPVKLYLYNSNDGNIKIDPKTIYPNKSISIREEKNTTDNQLIETGINYNSVIKEKHDVSAMLILNYQAKKDNTLTAENNKLISVFPEILSGGYSNFAAGSKNQAQRASVVGRLKYGYDSRYYLESNFRIDGSVKLHPDNRWAFFPTISGSWIIHNEPFFKNWKQYILSNLKLRGSAGLLGNEEGLQDYDYLNKYIPREEGGYEIGGIYRYGLKRYGNYPNPLVEWGKSYDYNGGIDLGFFKGKLGITFEYYVRYRKNMTHELPPYLFPFTTGSSALGRPYVNFGKIKCWGWDLTINHSNSFRKFQYNIGLTLAWGRDKVVDNGDESNLPIYKRKVGHSTGEQMMYKSLGLFQSQQEIDEWPLDQDGKKNKTLAPGDIKYKDQNGDGVLNYNDKIYWKNSAFPELSGSINLSCSYKGIHLSMMFTGVAGYYKNIDEKFSLYDHTLPKFQKYHQTDSWNKNNPNAMYPRIKFSSSYDNNAEYSDFWIRKCNYIRLSSINFGYTFPRKIIQKLNITSANISCNIGNLFTWSTLKGMDPETPRGYPVQKSFGASLMLSF